MRRASSLKVRSAPTGQQFHSWCTELMVDEALPKITYVPRSCCFRAYLGRTGFIEGRSLPCFASTCSSVATADSQAAREGRGCRDQRLTLLPHHWINARRRDVALTASMLALIGAVLSIRRSTTGPSKDSVGPVRSVAAKAQWSCHSLPFAAVVAVRRSPANASAIVPLPGQEGCLILN